MISEFVEPLILNRSDRESMRADPIAEGKVRVNDRMITF